MNRSVIPVPGCNANTIDELMAFKEMLIIFRPRSANMLAGEKRKLAEGILRAAECVTED
jgi:hypothetical protein